MENTYDIRNIVSQLHLKEDQWMPYTWNKAKIITKNIDLNLKRKGKLILCTAITPTKAGEGKTTTAIALADGLNYIHKNAIGCLREPSLGPVFGVKGGGAGGGKSTLYPEDDINLHFTGDIHAITSVNNLIAALIDNELYQKTMDVNPDKIIFPRAMDMNDRGLRSITTNQEDKKVVPHHSSFVITAASEIMAIFCLSKDEEDFLNRVENITVAYRGDDTPIFVRDLECRTAVRKLIHEALNPNLVQTLYHTPCLVHGGPFANIAHGTNSVIATDLALKLADYVVTEGGFGSDLGMEKYLDIVSPLGQFHPDLVVMVASIRALKLHGGIAFEDLNKENLEALEKGFENLFKHVKNVDLYHLPCLVSINHFSSDSEKETSLLISLLKEKGIPFALNTAYVDGPIGAKDLAEKTVELLERTDSSHFTPIVNSQMSIEEKIETICQKIYGADGVEYAPGILEQIQKYNDQGYGDFAVCMSKVPNSLSDNPLLLNVPKHTIHVKSLRLFTGAGFIVPLTGSVFTMPGLPKVPASKKMNED